MVRTVTIGLMAYIELLLLRGHKDVAAIKSIKTARRERESLLSGNEAFMLRSIVNAQSALPGVMAEVGVYQGCSARLISEASGGVPLHLFDTFCGLPAPADDETARLSAGDYAASLDGVQGFLRSRPAITFHAGLFPETAGPVQTLRFSFVHLDVDLKSSTRECLEFFYPRMVPGGMILTHDYSYLRGVREAVDEFLAGCPEKALELCTSQCLIVRRHDPAPSPNVGSA